MAHSDNEATEVPGPTTSIEEAAAADPLLSRAHPDHDGPSDGRSVEQAVIERAEADVEDDASAARVTFDGHRDRMEVTTRTLRGTVDVDDVDVRVTGGACIERRTDEGGAVLLEGDGSAAEVVRGMMEAVDCGALEDERREREQRRDSRHPSLTVGERNRGL